MAPRAHELLASEAEQVALLAGYPFRKAALLVTLQSTQASLVVVTGRAVLRSTAFAAI